MAIPTPTDNPAGSTDARDQRYNAAQFDIAMNGAPGQRWVDRFGNQVMNVQDAMADQATLAVNLANDIDPAKGAGIPAFGLGVDYPESSIGGALVSRTRTVLDYGASTALLDNAAALSAMLSDVGYITLPVAGTFKVASTVLIATAKAKISSLGAKIERSASIGNEPVFRATNVSGLRFYGLKFCVGVGTAHEQLGGFGDFTQCDDMHIVNCEFDGAIPGAATQKESLWTAFSTASCKDVIAYGNTYKYIFGNCGGCNDSIGDGTKSKRHYYIRNTVYNCVDTGFGVWTNGNQCYILANIFLRDDYSTPYNGVGVDVAGGFDVVISKNIFAGNTIGVRVINQLSYGNNNIKITDDNEFFDQYASSTEPASCIKIAHATGSGGSFNASVDILKNKLKVPANGYGVNIVSTVTDTAKYLRLHVDANDFDVSAASCIGIVSQISGANGNVKFIPGKNTFGATLGSGSSYVGGTLPNTVSLYQHTDATWSKDVITVTTDAIVGMFPLDPGIYSINFGCSTFVDNAGVGGAMNVQTKDAGTTLKSWVMNAGASGNIYSSQFALCNSTGTYRLYWDGHPSGHNHNYDYIRIERVM